MSMDYTPNNGLMINSGVQESLANDDCTNCIGNEGVCITVIFNGKEHQFPGEEEPCTEPEEN